MRVTNNMIMKSSSSNINATKVLVSSTNNQMTTQKKINRPSEDPVVAIRSLRLSTSLNRINQYYKKNIPDASSWLDVSETALVNMKSIITDVRTQCVNGSTGTLTADDRNTILSQLESLKDQLYAEGNADYAGRTVFTGYRTDSTLTFTSDTDNTSYSISQSFSASDITDSRYYDGKVEVPSTAAEVLANPISDIRETDYSRIRLGYDELDSMTALSYSYGANDITYSAPANQTFTDADGNTVSYQTSTATGADGTTQTLYMFDNEDDWSAYCAANPSGEDGKVVGDKDMAFIANTGELVLGKEIASEMKSNKATINIDYDKTGFNKGELKPEYYYNCTDKTDAANPVDYTKYDADGKVVSYSIEYTVAANQTLGVNIEASDVFDSSIQRDVTEMITAVNDAIAAHDKVTKLTAMKADSQYASAEYQEKLKTWIEAAEKEADYADDNLKKLYSTTLSNSDNYLEDITLGITDLGCRKDQLTLTKSRMASQQESVSALQSQNDDLDLSQIVIDYTAAYTAYQASLTAAGKLGEISLLNYI